MQKMQTQTDKHNAIDCTNVKNKFHNSDENQIKNQRNVN